MMAFFRTRLGKIFIWKKIFETWESDFKMKYVVGGVIYFMIDMYNYFITPKYK